MSNKKTVENTLLLDSVEVQVGNDIFEIKPLVRAQYKQLLGVFSEIILSIDFEIIKNIEENTGVLINILSEKALIELYKSSIDKSEKWIDNNMTINQEVELFNAICKVNDLPQMIKNFTKTIKVMGAIKKKMQSQN